MSYWRNQTKAFGLTGKISPHSLIGHNLILHRTKFYQKNYGFGRGIVRERM